LNRLSVTDHDRAVVGMKYVYPVVSRRARGVSVGVNLNPNNACNWRCVYCQVPGLTLGNGPEIDLLLLEAELRSMLDELVHGDFMERRVPEGARQLDDIAFSGNGEATTSPQFAQAVEVIARVLREFDLLGSLRLRLITNGSQTHRPPVESALKTMAQLGGEVWFKLDSATAEGMARTNSVRIDPVRHIERLRRTAELCPTWIQTCVFAWRGATPSEVEQTAYLELMGSLVRDGVPVRGVLLYGPARRVEQPEAGFVSALPQAWLEDFARRIEAAGVSVRLASDDFIEEREG